MPYSNYRGAVADSQGQIWLGLDTAIKAAGYTYVTPPDIVSEYPLSGIRDEYLNAVQAQIPLVYIQSKINEYLSQNYPGKVYSDYLATRTQKSEDMKILPSSLQFKELKVTNEYTSIPSELLHKINITGKDEAGEELINVTFDAFKLSNHKVILSYEPETVEDQEIMNSFGGLDFTPAYLVHLRPVILIDGERVTVGTAGVAMGANYDLSIGIASPNGSETVSNSMISGNMVALGIVSQKAVIPATTGEQKAADLLNREALRYIDNWNKAEDELALLVRVSRLRPLPTVVKMGGLMEVTYLLDQPQGSEWKGLFIDAALRAVETVENSGATGERRKLFMQLSGLQGSVLENKVFEDAFQVTSVSTAKVLGIANSGTPATPIVTIDQSNIETVLPSLIIDQAIKDDIATAVTGSNLTVRIPEQEISYEAWTGIAYIKENLETGEAGYMLSGMVAGGMTAINWPEYLQSLQELLSAPEAGTANPDPAAAYYIDKVAGTDNQDGQTVDTQTTQPLTGARP